MTTLTSANSVLMLAVAGIFPAPVQIQGYATDDAFASEDVDAAETMMGVDGQLSAGYTPYIVPLEINLMADSSSNLIFDTWITIQKTAKEVYVASATILLPGTNMLYTFSNGFLKKVSLLPAAKKVLQPRKFTLEFQSVTGVPV